MAGAEHFTSIPYGNHLRAASNLEPIMPGGKPSCPYECSERGRSGLAGFVAKVAEHGVAEEGVGAGVVAFALAAKPGDDVGVEAEGQLLLDGAIEGVADSVAPKLVGERRDVRKIDRAVRLVSEFDETAPGGHRRRARGEFLSHDFGSVA